MLRARALFALAGITVREAVRQPAVWIVLLGLVVLVPVLPDLTLFALGNEHRLMTEIGLATLALAGALVALFVAANVITAELESRTILTLLAKPLSRRAVVFGKFLGIAVVLLVVLGVGGGLLLLADWRSLASGVAPEKLSDLLLSVELPRLLTGVYLVGLSTLSIAAVLVLGSTVLPIAANAGLGFTFFALGHLQDYVLTPAASAAPGGAGGSPIGEAAGTVLAGAYRLLIPNLRVYTLGETGYDLPGGLVIGATFVALTYTVAMLLLAVGLLDRDL